MPLTCCCVVGQFFIESLLQKTDLPLNSMQPVVLPEIDGRNGSVVGVTAGPHVAAAAPGSEPRDPDEGISFIMCWASCLKRVDISSSLSSIVFNVTFFHP